jgi:glutathione S-transferase
VIEFYDNDMSVCCHKVRVVLHEKNLPYERHHLNLRAGDQFKPEFRAINPNAVVPVIVGDGQAIVESTVILKYLEDAYPEPSLSPATPVERAHMLQWMIRPDAGLHDTCGLTSFALAFRRQLEHLTDEQLDKHVESMPSEKRRNHIRALVQQGLDAPGVAQALRSYAAFVAELGDRLKDRDWLVGDQFSLADASLMPYVLRLDQLKLDWFWSDYPAVGAWLARCQARPSYEAITQYEDPKYVAVLGDQPAATMDRVRQLVTG